MLQKIRDLSTVKDKIDSITSAMNQQSETFSALQVEITELKGSFSSMRDTVEDQNKELGEFRKQLISINELKNSFEKELYDFKILKTQMTKKVLDKLESEIRTEVKKHLERLKADAQSFVKLRNDIETISGRIVNLSGEVEKFNTIASHIKAKDFELEKYAKELSKIEREKIMLLRKIDSLERLVSKARKRGDR